MKRVYISGPMTGLPDLNFPAFHLAAAQLRAMGLQAVNPAEINPGSTMSWEACMRADIKALCDCDALVMLPGWESSRGAHLEVHLAHRLGMQVLPLDPARLQQLLQLEAPQGFVAHERLEGRHLEQSECMRCAGAESDELCESLPCSPHEREDGRWVYFLRVDGVQA